MISLILPVYDIDNLTALYNTICILSIKDEDKYTNPTKSPREFILSPSDDYNFKEVMEVDIKKILVLMP
jgi:hypothetical protein